MKYTVVNNVKIYTVNTEKTFPAWISDNKKRQLLKEDADLRSRISLFQDFEFPTAATNIQLSQDGEYLLASGVYKPRINCYETAQLGLKFTRFLNSDIVKFNILTEDYRKIAFLTSDRSIEIHAAYGTHYRTRIPQFGRDLCYNNENCDLYCVGASSEIYRLNLEEGMFRAPFQTNSSGINTCTWNSVYQLVTVGANDGTIELWDTRNSRRCSELFVSKDEITSLTYHSGGLLLAVGLSSGMALLYDLRSKRPLLAKDHQYGLPINKISFHESSKNILSSDCKAIRIWNQCSGKSFTTIEQQHNLNDFCSISNTGLVLTANEESKMNAFYIPELGFAPRWCHHLDGLTEELEEKNENSIYDNYKFISKNELLQFGLESLIGTNFLRVYMHGYFIDNKLYKDVYAATQPFALDQYKKDHIEKKMKEKTENRIGILTKLPRVNKEYAKRVLSEKKKKSKHPITTTPLEDSRFDSLWTNEEFSIDFGSEEYLLKYPQNDSKKIKELFEPIEEEEKDNSDDNSEQINLRETKMYQLKEGLKFTLDPEKLIELSNTVKEIEQPFAVRLQSKESSIINSAEVKDRVITVKVQNETLAERKKAQNDHMAERKKVRRSIKSLRLPKIRREKSFYSRDK